MCVCVYHSHSQSLHWLKVNERIEYKLFSLTYKVLMTTQHTDSYLSSQPDLPSAPLQYSLFICCHPFAPTNHFLIENHRSLIHICITPSLESTSRFISSAYLVLSRFILFTCQPIFVIIATLIIHHSFALSLQGPNFRKILGRT